MVKYIFIIAILFNLSVNINLNIDNKKVEFVFNHLTDGFYINKDDFEGIKDSNLIVQTDTDNHYLLKYGKLSNNSKSKIKTRTVDVKDIYLIVHDYESVYGFYENEEIENYISQLINNNEEFDVNNEDISVIDNNKKIITQLDSIYKNRMIMEFKKFKDINYYNKYTVCFINNDYLYKDLNTKLPLLNQLLLLKTEYEQIQLMNNFAMIDKYEGEINFYYEKNKIFNLNFNVIREKISPKLYNSQIFMYKHNYDCDLILTKKFLELTNTSIIIRKYKSQLEYYLIHN